MVLLFLYGRRLNCWLVRMWTKQEWAVLIDEIINIFQSTEKLKRSFSGFSKAFDNISYWFVFVKREPYVPEHELYLLITMLYKRYLQKYKGNWEWPREVFLDSQFLFLMRLVHKFFFLMNNERQHVGTQFEDQLCFWNRKSITNS